MNTGEGHPGEGGWPHPRIDFVGLTCLVERSVLFRLCRRQRSGSARRCRRCSSAGKAGRRQKRRRAQMPAPADPSQRSLPIRCPALPLVMHAVRSLNRLFLISCHLRGSILQPRLHCHLRMIMISTKQRLWVQRAPAEKPSRGVPCVQTVGMGNLVSSGIFTACRPP
jgi:hypothetical protein